VQCVGWLVFVVATSVLVVPLPARTAEPDASSLAVVVGATSSVQRVTLDELRELYMRRQRLWADGSRAIPVNLPPGSAWRELFSQRVLGRSPRDLVSYWNARYFEGITPPPVLPSISAVRAYLASEPGAIAYLPADTVGDELRVLLKIEPPSR